MLDDSPEFPPKLPARQLYCEFARQPEGGIPVSSPTMTCHDGTYLTTVIQGFHTPFNEEEICYTEEVQERKGGGGGRTDRHTHL